MLESFNSFQKFNYKKLSPEEQQKRGILGRLEGIIADGNHCTRNGRKYPIELWEKVFEDPIMKEKIANKVCLGELGHPEDRTETDITKAAICLSEVPKKDDQNKLHGVFDILDTPCGRILKTLCDYGCKVGISSRGQGETFTDYDGTETVSEDDYNCECWDVVLVPGVESARLNYVTESLNTKTLYESLNDTIDSAKEEDKAIIKQALDRVGINYKDSSTSSEEDVKTTEIEAVNDGSDLVRDLQEALKDNANLSRQVTHLQEKLSVCYAKEITNDETVSKLKESVARLSQNVKNYSAVKASLKTFKEQLEASNLRNKEQKQLIETYRTKLKEYQFKKSSLNESLNMKDKSINDLNIQIKELKSSLDESSKNSQKEVNILTEQIKQLKTDSQIRNKQYAKKLSNAQNLVERYRNTAKLAVDRYIDVKAKQIGVQDTEIKNKLKEDYSFDDIDNICEELRSYKINISNLPFNFSKNNIDKITMHESKQSKRFENPDDVLDESFINDILNT